MRSLWALTLLTAGCGTLAPSMRYRAEAPRPRAPLVVDVEVEVPPATDATPFSAGDEVLLAASLRDALIADLRDNGPYTPGDRTDVRLVVAVDAYRVTEASSTVYWVTGAATLGVGLVLGPLVGAPIASREVELTARAALIHGSGRVLAEAQGVARSTAWTGLWYGREVGLGAAARPLMDDLLTKLAVQHDRVARQLIEGRALLAAQRGRAQRILAVLDLTGEGVEPQIADELTEYLAARLAARGSYRLVPRSALRDELREAKARSLDPCVDEACQIELGKAVAAEKTLAPRLVRVGETCALTATLFDLRTETAERAAAARARCDASALLAGVDELAAQFD